MASAGGEQSRIRTGYRPLCQRPHIRMCFLPVLRSLCRLRLCGIFLQPRDLLF